MNIQELLVLKGLPNLPKKIKLIRHSDKKRIDLYEQYKSNKEAFLEYQKEQGKPVFHECDYIVSFLGEEGTLCRLVGVFKVEGVIQSTPKYIYDLSEVEGFEDIKERVIIDWGNSTLGWHQWFSNTKSIIEIQPGRINKKPFTDYLDFVLDYTELTEIISNSSIHKDWKLMLSAVSGIYLILDKSTGLKYIGSASSEDNGIWGRWSEYIKTGGHGNNKMLKDLILPDSKYVNNFQFTLLMTLPRTMTRAEVIKREQLFKRKLGTQSIGLNLN